MRPSITHITMRSIDATTCGELDGAYWAAGRWGHCRATRMREEQSTLYPVTCGAKDGGVSTAPSFREASKISREDGQSTAPVSSLRPPLCLRQVVSPPPAGLLGTALPLPLPGLQARRRESGVRRINPGARSPRAEASCWAFRASYSGAADGAHDGDVMMADAGGGSQRTSYFASVLLRERGIVWSGMAQRKYTRSFFF